MRVWLAIIGLLIAPSCSVGVSYVIPAEEPSACHDDSNCKSGMLCVANTCTASR